MKLLNTFQQFKAKKKILKLQRQFETRSGRNIVVDKVRWKWSFGERIRAYSELGETLSDDVNVVVNGDFDQYEGSVTPVEIAKWIAMRQADNKNGH